jgi:predicted dehydrogenase
VEPLRAVIIGCGAIAGGYNERASVSGTFSHAAAYRDHPGFEVVACIETDTDRRAAFMAYWSIAEGHDTFASLRASGTAFDVASICAPTALHEELLVDLADANVKGVFCEKPMTADVDRATAIAKRYRDAGIPIAVNYTRRWNPSIKELAARITDGEFGLLLNGVATYDRGVVHHGSHMIDMIQMLAGPVRFDRLIASRSGHTSEDPLCDAVVTTPDGVPITLLGVDAGSTGVFELQLVFKNTVVALEDFSRHIRIRRATPEPLTPGRNRIENSNAMETQWSEALTHAFAEFHDAVRDGTSLSSDSINAVSAETVCAAIRDAARAPVTCKSKRAQAR